MAYVQQEPQLFGLTVRENIAYGVTDREVTQEDIEKAARQANAHDFIAGWPEGYDTLVGERGIQLSGGYVRLLKYDAFHCHGLFRLTTPCLCARFLLCMISLVKSNVWQLLVLS